MRIGGLGALEIGIIVLVILLIFGSRRLPEIGSSMVQGIRTLPTAPIGDAYKEQSEKQPAASGIDERST